MNEIVVGVDESTTARDAALRAAELAAACDRTLHIVMAVPLHTAVEVHGIGRDLWRADALDAAEKTVVALARELGEVSQRVSHAVIEGHPDRVLCDEAKRLDASIIVVGNKRVQGAKRVLGSIATSVTRHAPCDVLIAHTT
jgi:nucleotide-binding universal stress UspA family protein